MFKAPAKSQEVLDFEAANIDRKLQLKNRIDSGEMSNQLLADIESYNSDFYAATKTTGYCISKRGLTKHGLPMSSESRIKIIAGSMKVGDVIEMNPLNKIIKSFGAVWEEKVSEGTAKTHELEIGSTHSFQYAYLN